MNKQTTFIIGSQGTNKDTEALKIAGKSITAICINWNGTFTQIGECCSPSTQTLIIHDVMLPEHTNNLGLLIHCNQINCYKNGRSFTIDRPNLIICTTAQNIPNDLIVDNTLIMKLSLKK